MSARFWSQTFSLLQSEKSLVLLTVVASSGSAPRKPGARMVVGKNGVRLGTVGGGMAEAVCVKAAEKALVSGSASELNLDLRGDTNDVRLGVCGGTMKVFLTPLHWPREGPVLQEMLGAWKNSRSFRLLTDLHSHPHLRNFSTSDEMTAGSSREETLLPPEVLFIAGAGHIGRAMVPLAETLEFEIGIFDERNEELHLVPDIPIISKFSTPEALHHWFTPRACRAWVVLVTRGFRSDLAVLEAIKENIPKVRYLGILGSQRRISLLKTEWAAQGGAPFPGDKTHAPVGLSIGAETPAEIAISIFAEIIASRTKRKPG